MFFKAIARDIADEYIPYDFALDFVRRCLGDWTEYEKAHRPVDIDNVYEWALWEYENR